MPPPPPPPPPSPAPPAATTKKQSWCFWRVPVGRRAWSLRQWVLQVSSPPASSHCRITMRYPSEVCKDWPENRIYNVWLYRLDDRYSNTDNCWRIMNFVHLQNVFFPLIPFWSWNSIKPRRVKSPHSSHRRVYSDQVAQTSYHPAASSIHNGEK